MNSMPLPLYFVKNQREQCRMTIEESAGLRQLVIQSLDPATGHWVTVQVIATL
jgi:hypothetical protein